MATNLAADLLHKHSNSTQASSQTLCAVLKATLEVLESEGLDPTPSALFAAVMSSLERPQAYSTPDVMSRPIVWPVLWGNIANAFDLQDTKFN